MKKGFTLVEMLAVIVILSIVGVIIVPIVSNSIENSKQKAYEAQIKEIKRAAYDWCLENDSFLSDTQDVTINLGDLKKKGYINIDLKNPKTRKLFSNTTIIHITKESNNYVFNVTPYDLPSNEDNSLDSPSIILNGDYLYYVEVNSGYSEPGYRVTDSSGNNIDNEVTIQITKDNKEVSVVDTKTLGTYVITYQTTVNGVVGVAKRTIVIRDTNAPNISPLTYTVASGTSKEELLNILKNNIKAMDNYDKNVEITFSDINVDTITSTTYVKVTAVDSSNNKKEETIEINVE